MAKKTNKPAPAGLTNEAFARLHAAASTAAADQPVNVSAGDLQALLNAVGAPAAEEKPAETGEEQQGE